MPSISVQSLEDSVQTLIRHQFPSHRHQLLSLVIVFDGPERRRVLLGYKKRGFGQNKYNGFGGKVEKDESMIEACVREVQEEAGILVQPHQLQFVGRLLETFENDTKLMDLTIYAVESYQGEISEQVEGIIDKNRSDEMRPEWFDIQKIPFDRMWPDDEDWWPWMLNKKPFLGIYRFKSDMQTIASKELQELQ